MTLLPQSHYKNHGTEKSTKSNMKSPFTNNQFTEILSASTTTEQTLIKPPLPLGIHLPDI